MISQTTKRQGGFQLQGALDIYTVAELKQPLLQALSQGEPLLDLSRVDAIDGAGVQLLLLLQREVRAHGRRLRLAGSNPLVNEVLELCELSQSFVSLC